MVYPFPMTVQRIPPLVSIRREQQMRKEKMSLSNAGPCWRIPDELWVKVQPLLPPGKPHPLGCHRPRVDNRKAMDAIFYRLRTGCQWKSLDATGICSSSTAHRRFQEWTQAGVFKQLWARGLLDYDELKGLDWEWDKKVENYLALLHLACAFIRYRAAGLLG
jgi:transposase